MSVAGLISQGGILMYPLLALSVLAGAIALAKLWHFQQAGFRRYRAAVDAAIGSALGGQVDAARRQLESCPSPVARVAEVAIRLVACEGLTPEAAGAEIQRVGTAEIRALESWLRGLTAIAHLAPLIGLLGTIFGMIEAFQQIEQAGKHVSPALLAGGIWEALLTTAFGLVVAIPTTAVFFVLEGEVDNVRASMKDAVARLISRFGDAASSPEAADLPRVRVAAEGYGI